MRIIFKDGWNLTFVDSLKLECDGSSWKAFLENGETFPIPALFPVSEIHAL